MCVGYRGIQSSWLSLVPTPLHAYGMRHSETRQSSFFLKHASGPIVALYIRTWDSGPKVSGQKISNPNCSPRNTLDFRPVPRSIIHSSVTWVPLVPSDMRKAWSQPSTWSLVKSYWWVNHWNLSTTVRHKSWTEEASSGSQPIYSPAPLTWAVSSHQKSAKNDPKKIQKSWKISNLTGLSKVLAQPNLVDHWLQSSQLPAETMPWRALLKGQQYQGSTLFA